MSTSKHVKKQPVQLYTYRNRNVVMYILYDCTLVASEQTSVNHLFTRLTDEANTSGYCLASAIMAKVVLSRS